jgi:ribosomal protein S10
MNTENKRVELIDVNNETIASSFNKIQEYVNAKGYAVNGELKMPTNMLGLNKSLSFDTKKAKKTLRNYINRLHKQVNMPTANQFLHFLFKTIYKLDDAPKIDYSDKEKKIQSLRKQWKKAFAESEKYRLEYRKEKQGFYVKK